MTANTSSFASGIVTISESQAGRALETLLKLSNAKLAAIIILA